MHIIPRHIFSWAAFLLLSFCGYSQSSSYCSNTAMVPVFKQTFDQGGSSSDVSMAPGGSTNYIYGNVGTDGRYIVTPRVENAGKGDWTRGGDHTGDSNGNMFLVNAGSNKSILLQQTVNNLCSGSSYSFSAWAANVNTSKTADICGTGLRYPKLTFNIKTLSNVLLASYTTGNLPLSPDNGPVNWQKYGFQFDLPANTSSLRIEIVDAWGGGDACGNDLALDDILFEACIPQITVSLNSSNSNVCVGTSATIQSKLVNSPYTSPAYQWQKSADGISWANLGSPVTGTGAELLKFPSTALTDGGLYRVTVAPTSSSLEIATCSAHSNELSFTVNPLPQVAPSSNGPLCSGKDLSLKANASGGSGSYTQYLWTGPASFQSLHADTIIHAVQTTSDGTYTIQVTDSKGCSASGNLPVQINSTPTISVSSITDTICSGSTGLLSVISSIPNSSFYWDANVVAGVLTGNTTTTSPDLSGIQQSSLFNNSTINGTIRYNVYALTPANCSSDTLFPSITVLPNPDTPDAGIDTTLCNTTGFQLYGNTPVVGAGAWTQISGPNTAVFADSTLAHTAVLNLVPGTYRFAWRISNSCASAADTMMLYYTAKPAPAFAISDTSICGPASISFTNNTPNKSDYGFSWIFGNGTSSSLADPADVVFAPSVTGSDTTYNITLKAFTSCDTISITKTILVKQLPKAGLTVIPQNTCMPTNAQLINHSMGSNTTYKMIFGDGSDSIVMATDTLMHLYNAPSSTSFQPMVIATNSCGADTATAILQTIANLVNIRLNLQDTAVCGAPFELSFRNSSSGIPQFNWNWGDGTTSTSSDTGIVQHKYLQPGIYQLTLPIHGVCGDTIITRNIHIYPAVKAVFDTISANNCIGDSIRFRSISAHAEQLQWNINNSKVSNLQEFNFAFKQTGVFPVQLIANMANPLKTCSDSISRNIRIIGVQPGKGSITPLNGNCLPFVVQLTNQTNKPTSSVQWLVSNGESTSGDSASLTFNQSGTYKVLMQARNTGGCLFTDSATIQIKSPAGIIQYKGGAYCSPNNPISFTPQVSNTDSIEWNFGDGTILTTAVRTIKHQYKQQGIFRPVFTLISNTGCRIPIRNTDSIVIEVVKAGFSVNTVYECGTTTFHFKDSSTALNGIRNHYWRVNSQPAGNGRSAMASFKRTGAQLTELSVESNFGCTDNIRGAYNVGIYNFPQVHINSINEACMNNLMELKSNISSADSVIYRLWNLGNGQSATDSAVKVLYYDEGVYKVKLTASTVNTCYDSAIKQIAIHALPPISIAKEKNICTGDSIVLRVDGTASYVWKDQQNNMICNNCNTITVRPKESTQYQVIGYNEYGCSNIASTNVKVIKPGKLQVSPESVVCEGSSVRIWASGGSSYQWMPAPGLTIHNTAAPVVSPMSTTTYKVVGKDLYNCFTDTAFTRVVVGKPTPVSVGKDTSFIAGSKIKLRTEVTTNNIVQWKWSGGADLSCVFCPEPVARVVNDENIACTVTNEFGCVTSDTLKIRTFCPGAEVFIPNAFSPDGDGRNDWLYIQARGIKLVKNLRIYSRWGELVFEKTNFLPNDPTAGWNGSIRGNPANPDIYVYVCEVICEKGTPQLYKGNVAILK